MFIETPLQIQYTSLDTKFRCWTLTNNPGSSSSTNQAPTSHPSNAIPIKHLHVLSPAFYSRLASHPNLHDGLMSEILSSVAEENRTAQVSDNGELCALLAQAASEVQNQMTASSPPSTHHKRRQNCSWSARLYWDLISTLRRRPEPGSYPSPGHPQQRCPSKTMHPRSNSLLTSRLIQKAPIPMPQGYIHFLDNFVQDNCPRAEQRKYQRTLLRLFLARRVAGGSTWLLRSYGVVIWVLFIAAAIWIVARG